MTLEKEKKFILEFWAKMGRFPRMPEIGKRFKYTKQWAYYNVNQLVKEGFLKKRGRGDYLIKGDE
jgi:predicted transcriptional regulator